MTKKRVWALYRVSTERQGGEGETDIPMQEIACREYAKQKGWEIVHEIAEKISGYQTAIEERKSIKEILEGAENDEFDILLVFHSDRIGRQTEYALFLASLYTKGIEVWSTVEGELKNEEHEDSLINYIRFWTSEGESRKTSKRVKERMKQLNEEGEYTGGTIPYGYKLVDTGQKRNTKSHKTIKVLRIDEKEAEIVKTIFGLVVDKFYGAVRIAKYLNEKGFTNRGNVWRHNTISRMLRNPIYMGYKRYNAYKSVGRGSVLRQRSREEWKLQPFNPNLQIVSEEVFKKAQSIMDKRNLKKNGNVPTKSQVLLSGLAVCGYCGGKLTSSYKTNNYKRKTDGKITKMKSYRYKCHRAHHMPPETHEQTQFGSKTIDKHVEQEVLKAIEHLKIEAFDEEKDLFDIMELDSRRKLLKELEKEASQINVAYENAVKLFDDVMMGKVNMKLEFVQERLDTYSKKKIEIDDKINKIKNELEEAKINSNDLEKLKSHLTNWVESYKQLSDLEDKKAMLGQVLKEVVVKKDEIVIRFNIAIENALRKEMFNDNNNTEMKGVYYTNNNNNILENEPDNLVVNNSSNSYRNGNVNTPLKELEEISYSKLINQWFINRYIQFEYYLDRTV